MPARRAPDPDETRRAVRRWQAGERERTTLARAVRGTLAQLAEQAPGGALEVRVPPLGAVQCVGGPAHTRGTPPNVVETDPETWLMLVVGDLRWSEVTSDGRVRTRGDRADLTEELPALTRWTLTESTAPGRTPLPVQVVRASGDDWETVRETRLRALVDSPDAFCADLETERSLPEAAWRERLTEAQTFLALVGPLVVGSVVGTRRREGAAGLGAMWVEPSSRSAGVADALLEALLSWAEEESRSEVNLWVGERNHGAQRLYKRHGFTPTGRRKPFSPGADEDVLELARAEPSTRLGDPGRR